MRTLYRIVDAAISDPLSSPPVIDKVMPVSLIVAASTAAVKESETIR